jgi:hypothetical protein
MLGTAHILMIRHLLYKALPHRRGEGGTGYATPAQARQEFRRQLRFVRRNPALIGLLFADQGFRQPQDDLALLPRAFRRRLYGRRPSAQAQAKWQRQERASRNPGSPLPQNPQRPASLLRAADPHLPISRHCRLRRNHKGSPRRALAGRLRCRQYPHAASPPAGNGTKAAVTKGSNAASVAPSATDHPTFLQHYEQRVAYHQDHHRSRDAAACNPSFRSKPVRPRARRPR